MTVEVDIKEATGAAARETIRIPSNVMGLLRESYDTRQKVLDWMLSIGVIAVLIWAFWEPLGSLFGGQDMKPSQNVSGVGGALPPRQTAPANIYTYNLPSSRRMIRTGVGPTGTRPPNNPSNPPGFQSLEEPD